MVYSTYFHKIRWNTSHHRQPVCNSIHGFTEMLSKKFQMLLVFMNIGQLTKPGHWSITYLSYQSWAIFVAGKRPLNMCECICEYSMHVQIHTNTNPRASGFVIVMWQYQECRQKWNFQIQILRIGSHTYTCTINIWSLLHTKKIDSSNSDPSFLARGLPGISRSYLN